LKAAYLSSREQALDRLTDAPWLTAGQRQWRSLGTEFADDIKTDAGDPSNPRPPLRQKPVNYAALFHFEGVT
jgi:hypothetical protein